VNPTVGSLFAGIGGFDLGVQRAGCQVDWQVEIDPWCRQVLAKHWPEVPRYEDIKTVGAHNLKPVDWIVGGFPCQDLSTAGKQKGLQGDRSGLWWEMRRVIGELRPEVVIVENVPNLVNLGIEHVLGSLAEIGYDAEWDIVSAQDIGAPHLRKRIWIVAHADSARLGEQCGTEPVGEELRPAERLRSAGRWQDGRNNHWRIEPAVGRVANGVPDRVDRLKGLGNAVVPQIVEWIARRIITGNGNDVTANSNCRADGERGVRTAQYLCGSSEATAEGERLGKSCCDDPSATDKKGLYCLINYST
tara:strand:+ start:611 stop:1519 length:909 start_codon:yes stop_codon:yes gene_type:complete